MNKERELLNRCAVTLKARDICPFLLTEISEFLAQPEQDNIQYLLDQREWFDYNLTAELLTEFYIRAE